MALKYQSSLSVRCLNKRCASCDAPRTVSRLPLTLQAREHAHVCVCVRVRACVTALLCQTHCFDRHASSPSFSPSSSLTPLPGVYALQRFQGVLLQKAVAQDANLRITEARVSQSGQPCLNTGERKECSGTGAADGSSLPLPHTFPTKREGGGGGEREGGRGRNAHTRTPSVGILKPLKSYSVTHTYV